MMKFVAKMINLLSATLVTVAVILLLDRVQLINSNWVTEFAILLVVVFYCLIDFIVFKLNSKLGG